MMPCCVLSRITSTQLELREKCWFRCLWSRFLVVATPAVGGTGRTDDQARGVAGSADAAGFDIAVVASAAEGGRGDAVVATTAHDCLGLHIESGLVVEG